MVLRLPDSWSNWNFEGVGKPRIPGKNLSDQEREPTTNLTPTYGVDAGIWTRATLVGGECSHHCATLAPWKQSLGVPDRFPCMVPFFYDYYTKLRLLVFSHLFLEFSLWSRKRSKRYLKIFASLLSTVSKPPHAGTIFLNVTNKTLTFKSTLRRSDNPSRKSKEKKISIKGKTT